MSIFDFINALLLKKKVEYDQKIAPAYLVSLWLSHEKKFLDIVNAINPYMFSLKDDIIWKYYMEKVPKGKTFIKWVKKDEKQEGEENSLKNKHPFLSAKEIRYILQFVRKEENEGKDRKL